MADSPTEALPQILRRLALDEPDRPFVRVVDGRSWTFRELDELIELWAGRLWTCGVRSGDRVATVLPAGVEELALWMAASWLGAIEVAVNPALSGELLVHAIGSSRAVVVVAGTEVTERLVTAPEQLAHLRTLILTNSTERTPALATSDIQLAEEIVCHPKARQLDAPPQMYNPAAILFTSGTSGLPKGVLVPWGQIHATAEEVCPSAWWGETDVMYEPYPPFHVSGKAPICAMAVRGGEVVLRESFKTHEFFADVIGHGCTIALLVGGTAQFLLDQPPSPTDREHPLRVVNMLPLIDRVLEFEERFGVMVCGSFNMTEVSCPIVTGPERLRDATSAGRVREHYSARIVDEYDREVPVGQLGELVIRADRPWTMAIGYDGDSAATRAAWTNQWFHTGDLFRQDANGYYYFLERQSDTIRRRGENVSAALLERVILEHAKVDQVVVVGVPSSVGESDIMAWIVPTDDVQAEGLFEDLAELVAGRTARYMVPRFWRLTREFPRTPTAKIQRTALRRVDEQTWDRLVGGFSQFSAPLDHPNQLRP